MNHILWKGELHKPGSFVSRLAPLAPPKSSWTVLPPRFFMEGSPIFSPVFSCVISPLFLLEHPGSAKNLKRGPCGPTARVVMETKTSPLLEWVLRKHPDTPRSRAKQWILAGRVSVNGVVLRKPQEVLPDPGERLELGARHATTLDCGSGWQIHPRLSLLYLDGAFAIVNKGPGLISVPAPNCDVSALSILADFLAGRLKSQACGVAGRSLPPPYRRLQLWPVHRLDQYTSGVFCIATNPVARAHLIEQLKAHTMRREYVAFVEGRCRTPTGTWRQWVQLSRNELRQHILSETQARAPGTEAQEAITHYEVIAEYALADRPGYVTKLRLRLETGRKHQIRVQAAHAGLPLIGDRAYHPAYREPNPAHPCVAFPRQALHAERLSLQHPDPPGQRLSWTADLPKDLRQLENALLSSRLPTQASL
jgi:23S rRNA pseudouridine1911/1915/1917 synthase